MSRFLLAAAAALTLPAVAAAGYSPPSFIDGCQSADGRFVVTAAVVADPKAGTKGGPPKPNLHDGPLKWEFTWKDTRTGEAKTFPAQGVQAGQVYAQLFTAPDGETFALFNHVTVWSPGKSERLGANVIKGDATGPIPEDRRRHEAMSRRVVVYKKDGSILKELAVADFLKADEWAGVVLAFNRVHWVSDFGPLSHRATARPAYALCRVSPDYTVLQVRVAGKAGRLVNVDLTTGTVLPDDWKPGNKDKTPVRPFVGPDKLEPYTSEAREGFVPSLDPVRTEGKYAAVASPDAPVAPTAAAAGAAAAVGAKAPAYGPLALVKDGFKKLDTPTWLPGEKYLVVADIEDPGKLFKVVGKEVSELRQGGRGKAGPDGRYYGVLDGKLAAWKPGDTPQVILDKEPSLNDLVVGANGTLYFTTLKDPEKGRVTAVDVAKKTAAVVYDANDVGDLANPNGIALAPDGKFLYVGVSNYKDKKKSGIYRFPVGADGAVDVAAGKSKKWADVTGPDGLAVGPDGHLYATAGAAVVVLDADGKKVGEVKIPKGSGTNLCFGGPDGKTLFVTTNNALYAADPK